MCCRECWLLVTGYRFSPTIFFAATMKRGLGGSFVKKAPGLPDAFFLNIDIVFKC
jgi:hypothetical protein